MNTKFTQYSEVNSIIENLLEGLTNVFKEDLVGIYLSGSVVWGGFDEASDIDFMVATKKNIDKQQFEALDALHQDLGKVFPSFKGRLEILYSSIEGLQKFRKESCPLSVISPGEPFHTIKNGMDWLISWYLMQEQSISLFGPDAKTIIPPISQKEFLWSVANQVQQWYDSTRLTSKVPYHSYYILTFCRALYVHHYGKQISKQKAVEWASKEFPQWKALFENSLKERLQGGEVLASFSDSPKKEFMEYVVETILELK